MSYELNAFEQPVGLPVPNWQPPPFPSRPILQGRYCRLERLSLAQHAEQLYAAMNSASASDASWTYMAYGPFATRAAFEQWMSGLVHQPDPLFYAIVDQPTNQAVGWAAYLRIMPASGSIEVGHIYYSPFLKQTRPATEAMALMMQYAFELGYRRYEWKCDALNEPSKRAALRLGFHFEGVFRQATVVKGRNRDTAWFAVVDRDWPAIQQTFAAWLQPENFDADGRQIRPLASLRPA